MGGATDFERDGVTGILQHFDGVGQSATAKGLEVDRQDAVTDVQGASPEEKM